MPDLRVHCDCEPIWWKLAPALQRQRRLAICFLASAVAAGQAPLPSSSYRARVLGVFDASDGRPIEGVEITDMASGTRAFTTRTGTVSLAFLPDGGSSVRIRKLGYAPLTQFVRISPADTVPITLILSPIPTILPDVVTRDSAPHYVSPGLRDFEERRKHGLGQYIDERELRKNDDRELSDVLRRLSAVNVSCSTRTPRRCTAMSTRVGCPYVIYLNGARISDTNLLMLSVSELGGAEAYTGAGTIPAQYSGTGSACGVLLFWNRER
jgi:hypothetical protein